MHELRVIEVTPHGYRRMSELLTTYASLRLQAVGACVIALAERFSSGVRRSTTATHGGGPRHLPKQGQRLTLRPD